MSEFQGTRTGCLSFFRVMFELLLAAAASGLAGFIDAIVYPEQTREVLAMALRTALQNAGPHLGAFVLPPHLSEA